MKKFFSFLSFVIFNEAYSLIIRFLLLFFFVVKSFFVFGFEINSREQDSILVVKLQKEGIAAGKLGDFEMALEKFTRVYELRKKMYGSTSIKLTPPLNNMGITYKNIGNFEKAIEVYKKVESLCINTLSYNKIDLGIAYSNLGNIYRLSGDYNQALEYQRNA